MRNYLILDRFSEEKAPAAALARALHAAGNTARQVALDGDESPEDAIARVFGGLPPDLLVVDLSNARDTLPLRAARRLLGRIWGEDAPEPPVLALLAPTHLGQIDWRAMVDDFLLPPYDPGEAQVRLDLLLRRHRGIALGHLVSVPGVRLDLLQRRAVGDDGESFPLTPREFDLLRFLVTHRGRVFSRENLLYLVWGVDFVGGPRTVDIHIRRLRAKLPESFGLLLETRRGVGYGLRGA